MYKNINNNNKTNTESINKNSINNDNKNSINNDNINNDNINKLKKNIKNTKNINKLKITKLKNARKNINNLKIFINNLKKNTTSKCPCSSQTIMDKPTSKAQLVQICENNVIKSSQNKITSIRIEKKNNNTIKIDNITLNLLIQSITKKYVNSTNNKLRINTLRIEHYNKLCKEYNQIKLISKKASYDGIKKENNKTFPTLQDYILNSKDDIDSKIKVIKNCLTESFEILDKLFKEIQFHHCDPKCAQLFLFKKPNSDLPICMLADLDKVTFTINVNKNLYRIRLTKDKEINTVRGKFISALEKMKILNKITAMRYESTPKKSNLLEKIAFTTSACILLNDFRKSKELRDYMLNQILPKYYINIHKLNFDKIINLNSYYSPIKLSYNKITSFSIALKYIDYNYLYKNFKNYLENNPQLYSIICLEPESNLDHIRYMLKFCT